MRAPPAILLFVGGIAANAGTRSVMERLRSHGVRPVRPVAEGCRGR